MAAEDNRVFSSPCWRARDFPGEPATRRSCRPAASAGGALRSEVREGREVGAAGEVALPLATASGSAALRILLAASFVSDVGSGLTLPFLLIYLHDVRHIGLGISGLLIGVTAVVAVPVAPATGAIVDRVGPRFVCLGALLLQAIGTASLVFVHSATSAIIPIVVYGVGQGAAWPAFFALLAVLMDEPETLPADLRPQLPAAESGVGIGVGPGGSLGARI